MACDIAMSQSSPIIHIHIQSPGRKSGVRLAILQFMRSSYPIKKQKAWL
jgi:hypothetical protein